MKLTGIPIDKTPMAGHVLGGAGSFVKGLLGGLGAMQQLDAQNQEMQSELADRRRRDRALDMASQQHDLEVQRFLELKDRNRRQDALRQRQRDSNAAINRTLFDSFMSEATTSGQKASSGAGYQNVPGFSPQQSPAGGQDYPPEWQAQDDQLRKLADNGDITPEQYAGAVKMHAVARNLALKKQVARDFMRSIENDTTPGPGGGGSFWTSSGALGIEVDYDEKTGPDPLSQVPAEAMRRLQSGEPVESVAMWYQQLKDHVENQKNRRIAVNGVADEILADVSTRAQRLNSRQKAEIMTEVDRYRRGDGAEYRSFDEHGERAVRSKVAMIEANYVPVRMGSSVVYTTPEEAQRLRDEQQMGKPDPERKQQLDLLNVVQRSVGEFRYQPTIRKETADGKSIEVPNPESEESQFRRWSERFATTLSTIQQAMPRALSNVHVGSGAVDPSMQQDPAQTQQAMLPKAESAPTGGAGNGAPARNSAPPAPVGWGALNKGQQDALVERLRMEIERPSSPTGVQDVLAQLSRQGLDIESLPPDVVDQLAPRKQRSKAEMDQLSAEVNAEEDAKFAAHQAALGPTGYDSNSIMDRANPAAPDTGNAPLFQPQTKRPDGKPFVDLTKEELTEMVKAEGWTAPGDIQRRVRDLQKRQEQARKKQ